MGITVHQWRMRIGSICQKVINRTTCRSATECSTFLACVIAALFLIGGVELNPGPTVAELAKRLEEFISLYNTTLNEILLSVPALSSHLDEFVKDMSSLVNNMNELMKKQEIRLSALELSSLSRLVPGLIRLIGNQSNHCLTLKQLTKKFLQNLHIIIVTLIKITHQKPMYNHHCQLNDLLTML